MVKAKHRKRRGDPRRSTRFVRPPAADDDVLGQIFDRARDARLPFRLRMAAIRDLRSCVDGIEASALYSARQREQLSWTQIGDEYPMTRAAAHQRAKRLWAEGQMEPPEAGIQGGRR